MGALSSKSKSANVTLIRKSSNADNDASRNSKESSNNTTPVASTPAKEKVLPFDPRSPADCFNRTPITVSASSRNEDTPIAPAIDAVKVLEVDPRSPSQQVSRTPIVVESTDSSSNNYRRLLAPGDSSTPVSSRTVPNQRSVTDDPAIASSPIISPKTSLANICTSAEAGVDCDVNDPRSPTVTVPRTPVEEKQFEISDGTRDLCDGITKRLLFNQSACDSTKGEDMCELQDLQSNTAEDATAENDAENATKPNDDNNGAQRKPLTSVQNGGNKGRGTPRAMLQAKQCRTLEEEFSKNQRNILSQLVQDDAENVAPVPSTTQFVEEI